MSDWGIDSEYGLLRDVLLGSPESFRWLGEENAQYSALVRETLRRGYTFDRDLALRQHAEMVDATARPASTCTRWTLATRLPTACMRATRT